MVRRALLALGFSALALAACSSEPEEGSGPSATGGRFAATAANPFGLSPAECKESPAPAVFGNGLCICGDFSDVGNLVVEGSSDGNLGSVAVNGQSRVINNAQIAGSWASGKGFQAIGNVNVGGSVYTPGDLGVTGNMEVGANLAVGGALKGIRRLAVDGELGVRGANSLIGYQDIAAKGAYKDADTTPCGCSGDRYLDVGASIDKAKSKNDNTSKKVPTELGAVGYTDLELTTGSYYFGGDVESIGFQKIRVKGAVSIYIDGSLEQIGAEVFDIADGATLDLYVRGTVKTIGHLRLGDAKNPSAFRLFMDGDDEVSLAIGNQIFHGAIYAPRARLKYVGNTIVQGALFAKELTGIGNLEIQAARPTPPKGCATSAEPEPRDDGVGTPVVH